MGAADETRKRAGARADDLIAAVLEDHATIRSLFDQVETSPGARRQELFERLVAILAVHETAEEQVVHPLGRRAGSDADAVVDALLAEEDAGKEALAEIERAGVEAPDFAARLDLLRADVLGHAQHEEHDEHPLLDGLDEERLIRAARVFRAAQRIAPTHGHAHAPTSAAGNTLVGPFMAMVDRTRDAIHDLLHHDTII